MKEDLIKFETAKLAREKDINIFSKSVFSTEYPNDGKLDYRDISYNEDDGWTEYYHHRGTDVKIDFNSFVFAPTQALLQKWLRENYGFIVLPTYNYWNDCFKVDICGRFSGDVIKGVDLSIEFEKYEEAMEYGLFESLKLI